MNADDRAELWDELQGAGLATGDVPDVEDAPVPWYVRTMIGIAGWIAAGFLLGFVGVALAFVAQSGPASVIVGLLLCAAAIAMTNLCKNCITRSSHWARRKWKKRPEGPCGQFVKP